MPSCFCLCIENCCNIWLLCLFQCCFINLKFSIALHELSLCRTSFVNVFLKHQNRCCCYTHSTKLLCWQRIWNQLCNMLLIIFMVTVCVSEETQPLHTNCTTPTGSHYRSDVIFISGIHFHFLLNACIRIMDFRGLATITFKLFHKSWNILLDQPWYLKPNEIRKSPFPMQIGDLLLLNFSKYLHKV